MVDSHSASELSQALTLPGTVLDGEGAGEHRVISPMGRDLRGSQKKEEGAHHPKALSTSCRSYREEPCPAKVPPMNSPAWHLGVEDG